MNTQYRYLFFICTFFLCILSVDVSAVGSISSKTKERILTLQDVQSITNLLVSKKSNTANSASTTVEFKRGDCPKSQELEDDVYFLKTINKATGLPATYIPKQLVDLRPFIKTAGNVRICMTEPVAQSLYKMSEVMKKKGLSLMAVSGYRSQADQKSLYNLYALTMNKGKHHRVAPAGHSEHQLGTAVDVASEFKSGSGFAFSPESLWLKDNAHLYGFLISYEEGHEDKTGYIYEPWHIRYVGTENATLLRQGDYSLAYKPIYYKKSWMNNLLGRLKDYVGTQDVEDTSIGG
jgi:D-alanyl-D-alanine carboxypeptidase